jgi:hypothetical protein
MKEENQGELKDWRGVPINIGDTVIYTASHGRSSSLVEATVKSFTASGRVILDVVRESFGYRAGKPVNVAADRVTVANGLPKANVPTMRERKLVDKERLLARYKDDLVTLEAGQQLEPEWRNRNRDYYTPDYVRVIIEELEVEIAELRNS